MASDGDLRAILEDVLSEPRFDAPSESIWDRFIERVLTEAARLLGVVIDAVGGPVAAASIALVVVAVVVLFISTRLAGRRAATIAERLELARLIESGADPAEFLRRAEAASAAGDHVTAIRMRYIGGVLDLGRTGRIRYEPGLTSGAIAVQVDDPIFDDLTAQFDEIVYGGRPAGPDEDATSASGWQTLRSIR